MATSDSHPQTSPSPSTPDVCAVVVLAAGEGKRMRSAKSKLLHEISGHSMLSYAVNAAEDLNPRNLVVVVGNKREQVIAHLSEIAPYVSTAIQEEQRGTGHAVQCGLEAIDSLDGEVVVTYGDVPLLSGSTLVELVAEHRQQGNAVTVLTATIDDPTGYGRIVRNQDATVRAIVEHRDASAAERAIREINSGIYVFDSQVLRDGLGQLTTDNDQGELYLTDIISYANGLGRRVGAWMTEDSWQTEGVNDRVQLSLMNREMNRRILTRWMRAGVTIVDPGSTWIDADVDLGQDVIVWPGVYLHGATSIGDGAEIGPDTTLRDVEVGAGSSVIRSHATFAVIGADCRIGPFAHLRPGTVLADRNRIGSFVETKNLEMADGASIPHAAYVADASIDEGAQIQPGVVLVNDDGTNKLHTHIGAHAWVGANTTVVAPIEIGAGSVIADGTVIDHDVPAGSRALHPSDVHIDSQWVIQNRPSSAAAAAASQDCDKVHPKVAESRTRKQSMNPEEYK